MKLNGHNLQVNLRFTGWSQKAKISPSFMFNEISRFGILTFSFSRENPILSPFLAINEPKNFDQKTYKGSTSVGGQPDKFQKEKKIN